MYNRSINNNLLEQKALAFIFFIKLFKKYENILTEKEKNIKKKSMKDILKIIIKKKILSIIDSTKWQIRTNKKTISLKFREDSLDAKTIFYFIYVYFNRTKKFEDKIRKKIDLPEEIKKKIMAINPGSSYDHYYYTPSIINFFYPKNLTQIHGNIVFYFPLYSDMLPELDKSFQRLSIVNDIYNYYIDKIADIKKISTFFSRVGYTISYIENNKNLLNFYNTSQQDFKITEDFIDFVVNYEVNTDLFYTRSYDSISPVTIKSTTHLNIIIDEFINMKKQKELEAINNSKLLPLSTNIKLSSTPIIEDKDSWFDKDSTENISIEQNNQENVSLTLRPVEEELPIFVIGEQ